MADDHLSALLELIDARSTVTGGFALRGSWTSRSRLDDDLKFFAVVRGRVRVLTDGLADAVELRAGDVAVLNGREWVELSGGSGREPVLRLEPPFPGEITAHPGDTVADDLLIGGRVDLDVTGRDVLLGALPPVAVVPSATSGSLRDTLERLAEELLAGRPGSGFAVRQYSQLLLLDVLRRTLDRPDLVPGRLRLLGDDALRPALALIHDQPDRTWSLADLARAASMSRTTFAERFRTSAGTPPLAYLHEWRMLLAQRALRSPDTRIGPLAARLGYASESAFSTAFKRRTGEAPAAFRRRLQEERHAAQTGGQAA